MRVLILGGTQFVGRHLTEAALDAGHQVTLFNRGQTAPGLYPAAEEIHGDRIENIDRLAGRTWDVVFDPSGYVPRAVRASAEFLKDAVGRYVFISSISVYADHHHMTEGDPVSELEDPTVEDVGAHYGGLKVLCERVVTEIYGERGLNARPGYIVGAYDPIPRLPHLLWRFEQGGERLAGEPDQPVQVIDCHAMCEWLFGAVDKGLHGDYNLVGDIFPMRNLLDTVVAATDKPTTITYTSNAFLQENELRPVDELTFWVPPEFESFMKVSNQRAVDTGLKHTHLSEIITSTLNWFREVKPDTFNLRPRMSPLKPERETELLAKWHA